MIRQRNLVYRDPWFVITQDDVLRPDGNPGTYVVVNLKAGISVLAIDHHGSVHLTDEFHYAIGRHSIEVVSGGIEPGESPLQTAQRELQEELGIRATKWTALGTVDPFTSGVCSPTALFLAEELTFSAPNPEGTEIIQRVEMTLDEALVEVAAGRITHALTLILLQRVRLQQAGFFPIFPKNCDGALA